MPRQTEWIHKLPEIVEQVRQFPGRYLGRVAVERLFSVSPRQAIRVLGRMGAENVGGAMVLDRDLMVDRLTQLQQDETVRFEFTRREKLNRKLEEARSESRLRGIQFPAAPLVALQDLPEQILLEPGRLQVQFSSAGELLQCLMSLVQAISVDWDTFSATSGRLNPAGVGTLPTRGLE